MPHLPPSPADAAVLLVDYGGGDDGHRGQYNAMLARLFPLRRARFTAATLVARAPILCPQIEHAPLAFALTCLVRAMLGRRTVGFLMRPLPALHGTSLRLRLKRTMLRVLRRTPGVQVLTIVPFAIDPGLSRIADGWIYDLQSWDMLLDEEAPREESASLLAHSIVAAAVGRKVCCAVGRQDRSKGFDQFVTLYRQNESLRRAMLFAFGGKVDPALADDAAALAAAGGFAIDRFVSDEELRGLYAAAELVWCAYDPDYDQASGIMGRAMQLGIPVMARPTSVVARLCSLEGHPWVPDDADQDWEQLAASLPPKDPAAARDRTQRHGTLSLARLSQALDTTPRPAASILLGCPANA